MSEWNNAPPYTSASLDQLHESLGIPQFSGSASTDWYLVFNGLLIQGGQITIPGGITVFPLVTAFPQQVLGVFVQPFAKQSPAVSATTLTTFTIDHTGATHDAYWWAIGV